MDLITNNKAMSKNNGGGNGKNHPEHEVDSNMEHYDFSWGRITEKKTGEYVIWEYSFDELLKAYQDAGKRASDLQRAVFYVLEKKCDCSTRDISVLLKLEHGWKITPSTNTSSIFYQITHLSHEDASKKWAMNNLFFGIIPAIVDTLWQHTQPVQRH